jgi:hypothetical protein
MQAFSEELDTSTFLAGVSSSEMQYLFTKLFCAMSQKTTGLTLICALFTYDMLENYGWDRFIYNVQCCKMLPGHQTDITCRNIILMYLILTA